MFLSERDLELKIEKDAKGLDQQGRADVARRLTVLNATNNRGYFTNRQQREAFLDARRIKLDPFNLFMPGSQQAVMPDTFTPAMLPVQYLAYQPLVNYAFKKINANFFGNHVLIVDIKLKEFGTINLASDIFKDDENEIRTMMKNVINGNYILIMIDINDLDYASLFRNLQLTNKDIGYQMGRAFLSSLPNNQLSQNMTGPGQSSLATPDIKEKIENKSMAKHGDLYDVLSNNAIYLLSYNKIEGYFTNKDFPKDIIHILGMARKNIEKREGGSISDKINIDAIANELEKLALQYREKGNLELFIEHVKETFPHVSSNIEMESKENKALKGDIEKLKEMVKELQKAKSKKEDLDDKLSKLLGEDNPKNKGKISSVKNKIKEEVVDIEGIRNEIKELQKKKEVQIDVGQMSEEEIKKLNEPPVMKAGSGGLNHIRIVEDIVENEFAGIFNIVSKLRARERKDFIKYGPFSEKDNDIREQLITIMSLIYKDFYGRKIKGQTNNFSNYVKSNNDGQKMVNYLYENQNLAKEMGKGIKSLINSV